MSTSTSQKKTFQKKSKLLVMKRRAIRIVQSVRKLFWRVFQPVTLGVRGIVVDPEERILLIKHTYQVGWYLPGGAVKHGESILAALSRELKEEVGVQFDASTIRLLGIYSSFAEFKSDHVAVFVIPGWTRSSSSHFEVEDSQFYLVNHLPESVSPATKRRILEYLGKKSLDYGW